MPKRITYLTRRDDIDRERFRRHWSTTHAAIAVDLPGIAAYRQNHVVSEGRSGYGFDGIVELWFTGDEVVAAGLASDVADRLIEDELRFLSGLVGGAVASGPPTPHWPFKVWVLARDASPARQDLALTELSSWAGRVAASVDAVGHAVNGVDDLGPKLTRERLRAHPAPPELSACFGFARLDDARRASARITEAVGDLRGLSDVEVLVCEELVIV